MNRLLVAILLLLGATLAPAREVPYLSGRVVDEAHLLSAGGAGRIDARLAEIESSSGAQIVVLTVGSLEDETIEDFANRVFHTWQLGQKKQDNGVLLVLAKEERRSRIEVGYGLEGVLNDGKCGRILREVLAPRLRSGDFDRGIAATVEAIVGAVAGKEMPEDEETAGSDIASAPLAVKLVFGLAYLLVIGTFSAIALFAPKAPAAFLYVFLMPFHALFPMVPLGMLAGATMLGLWVIGWPIVRFWLSHTASGRAFRAKRTRFTRAGAGGGGRRGGDGFSWGELSTAGSSFGSSDSGGFSGGGGDSGGGGASSDW